MGSIKKKLIEIVLKKNRILGKLGLLPAKSESVTTIPELLENLNASQLNLQLYKRDEKDKDYIFWLIETLEKNGVQIGTLIEFDKIFSSQDLENISKISNTAKINFIYVYPNYVAGTNISTEMDIATYLETLKKIKHLVKVATQNYTKKEEQIMFIANQISEYVNYDFDFEERKMEEYLKLSSLQGCLEGKKTVCAGVALAFERCMTEMGIDNMLVLGHVGQDRKEGILNLNHVWNKVKIDDKWYNVDVTSILNSPKSQVPKERKVKAFILSSDESLRNVEQVETNSEGIPEADCDYEGKIEIYEKVSKAKNVLDEYDKGNFNLFLQFKVENNSEKTREERPQEMVRDGAAEKEK